MIHDPITVSPHTSIAEVLALTRSIPHLRRACGRRQRTGRDRDWSRPAFRDPTGRKVSSIATPKDRLVTVREVPVVRRWWPSCISTGSKRSWWSTR